MVWIVIDIDVIYGMEIIDVGVVQYKSRPRWYR